MQQSEKIAFCQNLIPEVSVSEEIVAAYLALAEQRIAERLYPFGNNGRPVPPKYDYDQCELAVRMIARRGGEGQTSHSENGVSRTYATVDDADILSRITPFVGVI